MVRFDQTGFQTVVMGGQSWIGPGRAEAEYVGQTGGISPFSAMAKARPK